MPSRYIERQPAPTWLLAREAPDGLHHKSKGRGVSFMQVADISCSPVEAPYLACTISSKVQLGSQGRVGDGDSHAWTDAARRPF